MARLDGKLCVITGATSGIGLASAEQHVPLGAALVLIGRDAAKGAAALARLMALHPPAEPRFICADLSLASGVREAAAQLRAAAPRIDVLINNAGAIFRRRALTADGLERTFALNHMAYFLMTRLIEAQLIEAKARIVNVASTAHRGAMLDFSDLQGERGYDGWTAYRRSKLCNILFTRELARRLAGTGATANSLHPGFVASRFGDENDGALRWSLRIGKRLFAISPERGALTSVYLASAAEAAGANGLYFDRCRPVEPSRAAQDDEAARRLWRESDRLAGLSS